jgi:hypothetical protein
MILRRVDKWACKVLVYYHVWIFLYNLSNFGFMNFHTETYFENDKMVKYFG